VPIGGGGVQVHKHVYVHVAPDENIGSDVGAPVPAPAPQQKHYKIIFIKAPSYNQQIAQQQAALATKAAEEKTLVYVLSRKPDDLPVGGPAGGAADVFKPSKPEVYFIKYKAQTGAAAGGNAGGAGGAGGAVFGDAGFGGGAGNGGAGVSVPNSQYGPAL